MDADRQADRIDRRMQLGRQSATRTTDRGNFSPCFDMLSTGSFAPLASAWTFEIVLSISTYSKSGVSAMLWKSLSHIPACDYRRNRA